MREFFFFAHFIHVWDSSLAALINGSIKKPCRGEKERERKHQRVGRSRCLTGELEALLNRQTGMSEKPNTLRFMINLQERSGLRICRANYWYEKRSFWPETQNTQLIQNTSQVNHHHWPVWPQTTLKTAGKKSLACIQEPDRVAQRRSKKGCRNIF